MKITEVEIYSDASNLSVIRHPGRKYPGSLIQGDSLSNLCWLADNVRQNLDGGDLEEARGALEELRAQLWGRYAHYKRVCHEHGIGGLAGQPQPLIEE